MEAKTAASEHRDRRPRSAAQLAAAAPCPKLPAPGPRETRGGSGLAAAHAPPVDKANSKQCGSDQKRRRWRGNCPGSQVHIQVCNGKPIIPPTAITHIDKGSDM